MPSIELFTRRRSDCSDRTNKKLLYQIVENKCHFEQSKVLNSKNVLKKN